MFETGKRWKRVLLQVVVTVMVLPYLFPLVVMVKVPSPVRVSRTIGRWLQVPGFARFFFNSAIIAVSVIALVYVCAMMAAFGFAKLSSSVREVYFWMLLACLTLPEVVLLAPLFTTNQKLGLYNTYWAVILPLAALQVPFAVLLTRNFIKGLPERVVRGDPRRRRRPGPDASGT